MVGREGRGAGRVTIRPSNHVSLCFLILVQKDDERYSIVEKTYREMHTKQTVAFVRGMVSQAQLAHQTRLLSLQGLLLGWVGVVSVIRLVAHPTSLSILLSEGEVV